MVLDDFSPEEQAVIDELQRRTIDCVTPKMLEDNLLFYRFAKARDFNLVEAEAMLRKHACWRQKFGTDTILTEYEPPEVFVKYVPTSLICFDKDGCAVRYIDLGRLDIKGLMNLAKDTDFLKYYSYLIEQDIVALRRRNKKLGKHIYLPIFDFENLPYSLITYMRGIQHLMGLVQCYMDNYPEIMKCAFVINAPFYFLWAFALIKQVIPAGVLKKIHIYGADGWKEELLKLIDAEDLPACLGGKRTDPDGDPQCKTIVKFGGERIPKSSYMKKESQKMDDTFKKLTILPFSKEKISCEVKEENSNLEWEYEVKSGDIDFYLHFKGETEESVELYSKPRVSTCDETEKGLFKCEKVGIYTMVLDNSYSWIHPKEVYFKAEIKSPTYDQSVK